LGTIGTRPGFDHQLESRSGAALKNGDPVVTHKNRRVDRAVRPCQADEGDLWTDGQRSRCRSWSWLRRRQEQLLRQRHDIRDTDELISIDIGRVALRTTANRIVEDERG